jgi:hypothetical protein
MDFIVIGGQKAGTTTFWHHLASHPQVFVPESKEAPFFSHDAQYLRGLEWHRARHFAAAPPGALLGTVTPHYMMGTPDAPVGRIAARIHKALPDVRLIALLRDPVERALSQYRMSVRRGLETRSFAGAVQELLEPDRLLEGRSRANETNSYIVQGEYGRVLDAYLQHFPRDQLLVLLTDDLDRRPAEVVKTAFAFLGVDDTFVPPNLGAHEFRGGLIPRLDRAAETELHDWLGEHVWPKLPNAAAERRAFRFWFKTWNVVPDAAPPISPATRRVLERHYRRDASRLRKLGVQAPWAAAKRQRPRVHPDPAPLVITGIGGSGTRAFMRIAEAAGCYMGRNVNRSGDAMELYEIAERWAAACTGRGSRASRSRTPNGSGASSSQRSHATARTCATNPDRGAGSSRAASICCPRFTTCTRDCECSMSCATVATSHSERRSTSSSRRTSYWSRALGRSPSRCR